MTKFLSRDTRGAVQLEKRTFFVSGLKLRWLFVSLKTVCSLTRVTNSFKPDKRPLTLTVKVGRQWKRRAVIKWENVRRRGDERRERFYSFRFINGLRLQCARLHPVQCYAISFIVPFHTNEPHYIIFTLYVVWKPCSS